MNRALHTYNRVNFDVKISPGILLNSHYIFSTTSICTLSCIFLIYHAYLLFGRLFYDEEDTVNQFNNSDLILKELDDIDVESSMFTHFSAH